jgi:bifunctional non-homologous end joining protein LigD
LQVLKIGKHELQVTHEDKILFPISKITKGDLINYYSKIAPVMIKHMKNRPVMMHRFVEGIGQEGFYQKNISDYFPDWIERAEIKKIEGGEIEQVLCNNPETLIYIANQLCITPHIWLSKIDKINYPDKLVFDLDPAGPKPEESFALVIKAAKKVKKLLENLGLTTFVMTTGSKGLHVVVPIKRENTFEYSKNFARDCATILEKENPEIFTTQMRKEIRGTKIFLDVYRNAYGQTSVAPYAVRAIEGAPIATPIRWSEVNKNLTAQKYNIKNIFARLEKKGDAWENFEKSACSLAHPALKLRRA